MISVVTPWRTLLSALGLIGSVKSEWVLMSIKPGVTASPLASMTFAADGADRDAPSAAMRPPCTRMSVVIALASGARANHSSHRRPEPGKGRDRRSREAGGREYGRPVD